MASLGDIRTAISDVRKLVLYLEGVYHATEEREELLKEIDTLSAVVDKTESAWSNYPADKQREINEILRQVRVCLLNLTKQLNKSPKFWKNLLVRVMWPTQKPDVEKAIQKVKGFNEHLSQLTILEISTGVFGINDAVKKRDIDDFIQGLTPSISEEVGKVPVRVSEPTKGTGQWFHDVDEYAKWCASRNGFLWVHGPPGCGKSGLATVIFTELAKDPEDSQAVRVACIYCDHQNVRLKASDPMDIVMSFWAQLVEGTPGPLFDLNYIEKARKSYSSRSPEDEMKRKTEIFRYTAEKIDQQIVLILDGLDELPQDNGQQDKVVKILRNIQTQTERCRILITSRPYKSIMNIFQDIPRFELRASKMDLELYMEDRLSRQGWYTNPTYGRRFCETVIKKTTPRCKDLFLLCKLFMDDVLKADSVYECLQTIEHLPESARDAYDRGLVRLAQESPHRSSRGQDKIPCTPIQALFWVTHVPSPITESQLCQALAIEYEDCDYDNTKQPGQHKNFTGIVAICGGWIIVDIETGQVQVAHKTLTEHLTDCHTRKKWFPNIQQHIPRVLLQYLLFDCMKLVKDTDQKDFLKQFPLCPYAMANWGEGLAMILEPESALWKTTERFLSVSTFRDWNKQVKHEAVQALASKVAGWEMEPHFFTPGTISGQHWAVLFNLPMFLPALLEHQNSYLDPIPTTPLGLAAAHNRENMVHILLENGVKLNITQADGRQLRTPLYDAIFYRNKATTRLLLEHGADVTLRQGHKGLSPLDLVYILGREEMAQVMASWISEKTTMSAQEFQFLVRGCFTDRLAKALERGLDANQPCENGKLALDYARELGNPDVIDILVTAGAVSKLTWPPVRTDSCPYPLNFSEPSALSPIVSKQKSWDTEHTVNVEYLADYGSEERSIHHYDDGLQEDIVSQHVEARDDDNPWTSNRTSALLLEVAIPELRRPIKSIVFETVSWDQGWSSHDNRGTYVGSTRSWIQVRVKHQDGSYQSFRIQHNVHASGDHRLHTNIWNLSELEISSPRKAEFLRSIRPPSVLQVSAHAYGGYAWANNVSFVQVRLYDEDLGIGYLKNIDTGMGRVPS